MERQGSWYSSLEDVRDHEPEHILWYLHGYEAGPLIFPAGYTPEGPATGIGTIASLQLC